MLSTRSSKTMEKLCTPKHPSHSQGLVESSVFLTPPSPDGKPPSGHNFEPPSLQRLTPSSLLLSPVTPEPRVWEPSPLMHEHLDIVSELYLTGHPMVSDDILAYLTPADLHSCLHVCSNWNTWITSNRRLMAKVNVYLKQHKENSENLEKEFEGTSVVPAQRRALGPIAPNMQSCAQSKAVPVALQAATRGLAHRHRPCPNCQSPAKELNRRRAECSRCHFDFCQHCFKAWHEGDCSVNRSPKRVRGPEAICGTKKSKKRLRRL